MYWAWSKVSTLPWTVYPNSFWTSFKQSRDWTKGSSGLLPFYKFWSKNTMCSLNYNSCLRAIILILKDNYFIHMRFNAKLSTFKVCKMAVWRCKNSHPLSGFKSKFWWYSSLPATFVGNFRLSIFKQLQWCIFYIQNSPISSEQSEDGFCNWQQLA